MATIKFGGGVTDARGSLAGNTFTRSRAGAVMRQRVAPIQPNSVAQSNQRAVLASAVAAYTSFTSAQVAAWQAFAEQITKTNKLGDTYTPSAIQIYVGYFIDQLAIGTDMQSFKAQVPNSVYQPELLKVEAAIAEETADTLTNLDLTVLEATSQSGRVLIKGTPPHAPALQNASRLLRSIPATSQWDTDTPLDLLADYVAQFGSAVTAGEIIDLEVKIVLPLGLSSAWYRVQLPVSTQV